MDNITAPAVLLILGSICLQGALFGGMVGKYPPLLLTRGGRVIAGVLAIVLLAAGTTLWVWTESRGLPEALPPSSSPPSTSPPPTTTSVLPSTAHVSIPPTFRPTTRGPDYSTPAQTPATASPTVDPEDARLLEAFRGPGDGAITARTSTAIHHTGSSSLEIRFLQNANYYEAYFDLRYLYRNVTAWTGREFSCFVYMGPFKSTRSTWGGIVFKDPDYRYDYGADIVFADIAGDWTELRATVGQTGEPNRWGGYALQDDAFTADGLNGFAVFFAPSSEGLYTGRSIFIDECAPI